MVVVDGKREVEKSHDVTLQAINTHDDVLMLRNMTYSYSTGKFGNLTSRYEQNTRIGAVLSSLLILKISKGGQTIDISYIIYSGRNKAGHRN